MIYPLIGILSKKCIKGVPCVSREAPGIMINNIFWGEISETELKEGYLDIIKNGADIIEANLGIEAGDALKAMQGAESSKKRYFY
jgi:hypothetical protein